MRTVLWVDDLRDPPNRADERYVIARSVNKAKFLIEELDQDNWMDYWIDGTPIEELPWFDVIDLDHDAGVYAAEGGDYINILNYLEARANKGYKVKCAFRIHSFNTVGYMNMKAIIEHNGWRLER